MRRRGRRTIGIRGEELVGVLYGVGGSRMWMMVQPVVLPSLRILLEVVGLAVHREERRGGRKTGQAKPQNATSLAAQTPALPTRCRVAVTHSHVSFPGRPMRQSTATGSPYKPALSKATLINDTHEGHSWLSTQSWCNITGWAPVQIRRTRTTSLH